MAKRPVKSDLLLMATKIANLDLIDETADGGRAYKAFQLQVVALEMQAIIQKLQGKQ